MSGSLDLNSTADISDTLTLSKASGTGLDVTSNATVGGTLGVTGSTTMSGSLDLNSTADISDTLTLSKASGTGLDVTSNATVGGTLGVTGSTTMSGSLDLNSTADISDTLTLSKASGTGLDVTSNATVGGTLGVTGSTTMSGSLDLNSTADISDTLTLSKSSGTGLSVTSNATVGGTLGVTGSTTMSGSLDLNSTADISDTLTLSKASGTGLDVTSNATVGGTLGVTGTATVGSLNTGTNGTVETANMKVTNIKAKDGTAAITIADTTGNVVIKGDLTVEGSKNIVHSNEVDIGDNIIKLNSDLTGAPSENAGIEIERGTADNVKFIWDETSDTWSTDSKPLCVSALKATTLQGTLTGSSTSVDKDLSDKISIKAALATKLLGATLTGGVYDKRSQVFKGTINDDPVVYTQDFSTLRTKTAGSMRVEIYDKIGANELISLWNDTPKITEIIVTKICGNYTSVCEAINCTQSSSDPRNTNIIEITVTDCITVAQFKNLDDSTSGDITLSLGICDSLGNILNSNKDGLNDDLVNSSKSNSLGNFTLLAGAENATDITTLEGVNGTGTIDGSLLTAINGTAAEIAQALTDLDTDPTNFNSTLSAGAARCS